MKTLSIKQPWADVIRSGHKEIEIRSWQTKYRGDILVVSSLSPDRDLLRKSKIQNDQGAFFSHAVYKSEENILNGYYFYGAAICIAELYSITPFLPKHAVKSLVDFESGLFAWHLRNIREVENIHIKGQLGFYNTPDNLIKIK